MKLRELLSTVPARKREDAIWLILAKLGWRRSQLILEAERELDSAFLKEWKRDWNRRQGGEPLQYIAGSAPFFGRELLVNRSVLIPRPETEVLVELSLELLKGRERAAVIDIGTGSGAIALTLKLERPGWSLTGTDISSAALAVARRNAEAFGVEVAFLKRDLFPSRSGPWDLVVSNPPYLDFSKDKISPEVQQWEPRLALEPLAGKRIKGIPDRASWCAEQILRGCASARVGATALELSPRVARAMELRWRKHPKAQRVWRAADLAGRKRFLLVAWRNA